MTEEAETRLRMFGMNPEVFELKWNQERKKCLLLIRTKWLKNKLNPMMRNHFRWRVTNRWNDKIGWPEKKSKKKYEV